MNYIGNQLKTVEDNDVSVSLNESADFKNNSTAAIEYTYDLNGSMVSDLNKRITGITYNSLNLPKTLTGTMGSTTVINTYVYSATGRKLSVEHKKNGSVAKKTDYVGNIIYEGNASSTTIKRILIEGGYIEGGVYYFNITDHLGNVRVVANSSGTLVQSNHYYPFGMAFAEGVTTSNQPYKYNGKELDKENGINWYDYDARHMDPALGRFTTMDPLAEKHYNVSPYAYVLNNPLRYIDPDGRIPWDRTVASYTRIGDGYGVNRGTSTHFGYSYTKTTLHSYSSFLGTRVYNNAQTTSTTYYIIVTTDKNNNVSYKIYDNEDEYNKAAQGW